jgi:hypothetical protein
MTRQIDELQQFVGYMTDGPVFEVDTNNVLFAEAASGDEAAASAIYQHL